VGEIAQHGEALLDDGVRFLPLIWATKPTPQASCSFAGWYNLGSFRITLGSDEWGLPAAEYAYSALLEAGL